MGVVIFIFVVALLGVLLAAFGNGGSENRKVTSLDTHYHPILPQLLRSEERRVGKECYS